ncbi:MAG: hypothetical protein ACRCTP_04625 [Aeromonas popoffii]|uniref:hypothetical protein n=1 Tax=Aeromonas popoffii TaxID=70856 RepID=UPI003F315309
MTLTNKGIGRYAVWMMDFDFNEGDWFIRKTCDTLEEAEALSFCLEHSYVEDLWTQ